MFVLNQGMYQRFPQIWFFLSSIHGVPDRSNRCLLWFPTLFFRNRQVKPLPGDDVRIDVLDEEERTGNITDICERRTELIRPAVANADQAMIVFAAKEPEPNLNLLDRFLVLMREQGVDTIICFNKKDQLSEE